MKGITKTSIEYKEANNPILFFFKELNIAPMNTTWVFIGLLAVSELGIRYCGYQKVESNTVVDLEKNLLKTFSGLSISVGLVYLVKWLV